MITDDGERDGHHIFLRMLGKFSLLRKTKCQHHFLFNLAQSVPRVFYRGPQTCCRSQARTRTLSGVGYEASSAHREDVAVGKQRYERPKQSPRTAGTRKSAWPRAFRCGHESCPGPPTGPCMQVVGEQVGRAHVRPSLFHGRFSVTFLVPCPRNSVHTVLLFFAIFHCHGQLEDKRQVDLVWCMWFCPPAPVTNARLGCRQATLTTWWDWRACSQLGARRWAPVGSAGRRTLFCDQICLSGSCHDHSGRG